MPKRCPICGAQPATDAFFCIACGAPLSPTARKLNIRPVSATGPTTRLRQQPYLPSRFEAAPAAPTRPAAPSFSWRGAVHALIGILFAAAFTVSFAQLIAVGGIPGCGLWSAALLAAGALLAQQAWVNGDWWAGARGMLLWGGVTGLVAFNYIVPWVALPFLAWCALLPRWYRH